MWTVTIRDLQWRKRRFVIAVLGASLVFALTLLMTGLAGSFRAEAGRTIEGTGADAWLVRNGVSGPFTGLSALPEIATDTVRSLPGVVQADPLVVVHQAIDARGSRDVNLFGVRPGGLGIPALAAGRVPARSGEAVINDNASLVVGDAFMLAQHRFRVVGLTHGQTLSAGSPNVYLPLDDVQAIAFAGQHAIMAVLVRGIPEVVPAGMTLRSPEAIKNDLLRPLRRAIMAIELLRSLLWLVAASLVGSVVYLSALERLRDFAVFRATGTPAPALAAGLAVQAVVVALAAAGLGVGVAHLLAPAFPLPVGVPRSAVMLLPAVALAVGLAASAAGLRRVVTVDPALAFGSAS
ncbi:MAG: putative transport system permease protein [Actinomycetota bacterium]|jgi:putative ABC transport system permease protein